MKQKTYRLSLIIPSVNEIELDIVYSVLISAGISLEEIVEDRGREKTSFSLYIDDKKSVDRIKNRFKKLSLKKISIRCKPLLAESWINAWKDNFKPFRLTDRFDVVPLAYRDQYKEKKNRYPLIIDTSLAFGTGMHETTRFVARCIERCQNRFERFIDIGTGTGILTLVALGCGAQEVSALDISQDAVKIANNNFKLNGYDQVSAKVSDIYKCSLKDKYDFVAANLVTHDLLEVKNRLVSLTSRGGYLALSGISLDNYKKIREGFKALPIKCVKIERGKEWVALLFKKNK